MKRGQKLGKGKRIRQQRREQTTSPPANAGHSSQMGPAAAGTPRTAEELERQVMGLGLQLGALLLQNYLHLSVDLRGLGPMVTLPEPPPGQEELYAELLEKSLAVWEGVGEWRITRHADNAAETLRRIAPMIQVPAAEQILAIGGQWIAETGYEPEHALWFAGAKSYAVVMAPPGHRLQTLELLDWSRLDQPEALTPQVLLAMQLAGAETPLPEQRLPFSLTDLRSSRWGWDAVVREPEAMLHAAAALVCWLWNEPGAVNDPWAKASKMVDEQVMPLLNKGAAGRKAAAR